MIFGAKRGQKVLTGWKLDRYVINLMQEGPLNKQAGTGPSRRHI